MEWGNRALITENLSSWRPIGLAQKQASWAGTDAGVNRTRKVLTYWGLDMLSLGQSDMRQHPRQGAVGGSMRR